MYLHIKTRIKDAILFAFSSLYIHVEFKPFFCSLEKRASSNIKRKCYTYIQGSTLNHCIIHTLCTKRAMRKIVASNKQTILNVESAIFNHLTLEMLLKHLQLKCFKILKLKQLICLLIIKRLKHWLSEFFKIFLKKALKPFNVCLNLKKKLIRISSVKKNLQETILTGSN